MKNRRHGPFPKNGKFWCWHTWVAVGEVGLGWDLAGVHLRAKGSKCDKRDDDLPSIHIAEVPDEQINPRMCYH